MRITNLSNLITYHDELIRLAERNPDRDQVFHLWLGHRTHIVNSDVYITGSSALYNFAKLLSAKIELHPMNFTPKDVDLMVLTGDRKIFKHATFDLVHRNEKTPAELILNLDLPCTRIAFGLNNDVYISLHCIYALFTGICFVPKVISDESSWIHFTTKYLSASISSAKYTYRREQDRIQKYQERGFQMKFIDSLNFQWIYRDIF